jgi:hypothetical protein
MVNFGKLSSEEQDASQRFFVGMWEKTFCGKPIAMGSPRIH